MFRYSTAISITFDGVFNSIIIFLLNTKPNTPKNILTAKNAIKAIKTAVFILLYIFAPKYRLTITDAPIPPPMAIQIKTVVKE